MPEIYRSPHVGTMADLIRQRGQIAADQARAVGEAQAQRAAVSGQAWGNAIQNIGQTVSGTLRDYAAWREQAPQREADAAKRRHDQALMDAEDEQMFLAKAGRMAQFSQASGYTPESTAPLFEAVAKRFPQFGQSLQQSMSNPQALKAVVDTFVSQMPGYKAPETVSPYQRGKDIAARVGSGPVAEMDVDPLLAGPDAGRVRYSFGPGTAEGPELIPTQAQLEAKAAKEKEEAERAAARQKVEALGGFIGPNGQVVMPPKAEREPSMTREQMAMIAESDDPRAPQARKALERLDRMGERTYSGGSGVAPDTSAAEALASDPTSQSLLAQTGLSLPGFFTLTGKSGSLARDARTRTQAMADAQRFANQRGIDVGTFVSQYKALNDVLEKNIERFNQVRVAEGELSATLDNLSEAATESGLNSARAFNAAKLWLGGEVNDPDVQKYAFHLNQLRSELAFYNAATQGRAGNVLQHDTAEAERVLKQGIASGSLDGLKAALKRSVEKMGTVLQGSVDRASQDVWALFGVGDKYKPKGAVKKTPDLSGLQPGHGRTFDSGPFAGQTWTVDATGQARRVGG